MSIISRSLSQANSQGGSGSASAAGGDLSALNSRTGSKRSSGNPTESAPIPMSNTAMCHVQGNQFIMFGGRGEAFPRGIRKGTFDSKTNMISWEPVPVSGKDRLEPRQGHIMECMDHKVYVYGGTNEDDVTLDKLHVYHPEDSIVKVIPFLKKIILTARLAMSSGQYGSGLSPE